MLFFQLILSNHTFRYEKDVFVLDDKPFQMMAGEMHPSRIPYQYWRHRIQMAKSMGMNTIASYIFWNIHEDLDTRKFDFETPQNNISRFFEIAQEEGMWVAFRPGPYVCGEWDFGGLPSYLLANGTSTQLRTINNTFFKESVVRYFTALTQNIKSNMVYNGGNILIVQLENEYGFWKPQDHEYIVFLRDLWIQLGINGPFYTADPTSVMNNVIRVPGAAVGINGAHPGDLDFKIATDIEKDVPHFVTEIYPGWIRHWKEGKPAPTDITRDIRDYMKKGRSFTFYMLHGGTNFGFTAGANSNIGQIYQPDLTSYDYGSPIGESGNASYYYQDYRRTIQDAVGELPPVPAPIPMMNMSAIKLERIGSLFSQQVISQKSDHVVHFEAMNQSQGIVNYKATLPVGKGGKLELPHVRDFVTIYLNGKLVSDFDCNSKWSHSVDLPAITEPGLLEIVVEGWGHINWDMSMQTDVKGLAEDVKFNGQVVLDWTFDRYPLAEKNFTQNLVQSEAFSDRQGGIFRGYFNLTNTDDTYLSFMKYSRGYMFVNGKNLGRYWNVGAQQRLFCPGVWLKKGVNEIVIIDQYVKVPQDVIGFDLFINCRSGYDYDKEFDRCVLKRKFEFKDSKFQLDGKDFVIMSGEIQPSRIPFQYWKQRIQMAKAMGLNTVSVSIPWNEYIKEDGSFDFESGQNNVSQFLQICVDESMFVIFRTGPYSGNEWDFGGLPISILSDKVKIRSNDAKYKELVESFIRTLAQVINPFQVQKGGSVLMIQIESNYGAWPTSKQDMNYIYWLTQIWPAAGISVHLTTCDSPALLSNISHAQKAAIGLSGSVTEADIAKAKQIDDKVPIYVSDVFGGEPTRWNENYVEDRDISSLLELYLDKNISFNINLLAAGTNFGLQAGENYVTNYRNGALVDETGKPSTQFSKYRDLIKSKTGNAPINVPEAEKVISFDKTVLKFKGDFFSQESVKVESAEPQSFETLKQRSGFVVYEKVINATLDQLKFDNISDLAWVYLDGQFVGKIDYKSKDKTVKMPILNKEAKLEIVVEVMGHLSDGYEMTSDFKGVIGRVYYGYNVLLNWTQVLHPIKSKGFGVKASERKHKGGVYSGSIQLDQVGDVFVDLKDLTKGYLFINGYNLGRYWNVGPQFKLYCPGSFLKIGENLVEVLDLESEGDTVTLTGSSSSLF